MFVTPRLITHAASARQQHGGGGRGSWGVARKARWILIFFAVVGVGWLAILHSGALLPLSRRDEQQQNLDSMTTTTGSSLRIPPGDATTTTSTTTTAVHDGDDPSATTTEPIKETEEDVFVRANSVVISNSSDGNYFRRDDEDPLSDHLTGFPSKPWTLEEMKLCQPKVNIVLKEGYECDVDPTCLKCLDERLTDRFTSLRAAFRTPSIEAARRAYIREKFPVMGQVVVVFAFNFAHSDLFLNWACSVEKLGMDAKSFTLVAPCDTPSTELMKRTQFSYVPTDWLSLLKYPIKSSESHWGSDHADINNVMLFLMNDLVSMGYHVLVHDADIAWLKDPRPFLVNSSRRRDFIAMLAPFWTSMGPVNTGFLFLAPTRQLWVFLKSMENAAIIKGTSDQKLWNHVLRHFTFQQLEWRLLPQEIVYKYSGRHAKKPGHEAIVVHALGGSKRQKLLYLHAWHLIEGKCSFYDATAAKLSQDELNHADRGAFANLLGGGVIPAPNTKGNKR
jgi:hypothetical protein